MAVEKGNTISVEYTGKFPDGEVFDASDKHGQPLKFEAGTGQVVPGFDAAVLGMEKGEEKEFTLKPEEAYGERREELQQKVPKEQLPEEAEKGSQLMVGLPNGQRVPATVADIEGDMATIDLNHPLAGKTLVFSIKVVDIE